MKKLLNKLRKNPSTKEQIQMLQRDITKKITLLKETSKNKKELREELIKDILSFTKHMEITLENDIPLTKEHLETLHNEKLLGLYEELGKDLEQLYHTK